MNMFYESVFVVDEDYKLKGRGIHSPYKNPSSARLYGELRRKAQDDTSKAAKKAMKDDTYENNKEWEKASDRLKKYGSKFDSYHGGNPNKATEKYRSGSYAQKKRKEEYDRPGVIR